MIYEKVGDKKQCQSLYTYTGNVNCDGWGHITLEECKAKAVLGRLSIVFTLLKAI